MADGDLALTGSDCAQVIGVKGCSCCARSVEVRNGRVAHVGPSVMSKAGITGAEASAASAPVIATV